MRFSNLQFITNYQSKLSHIEQVQKAIEGGVKWIQYRPKDVSSEEIEFEAEQIIEICKSNEIKIIINDNVSIAHKLNADGVHLGKNDMEVAQARKVLGNEKIIGGTANNFEDIKALIEKGVDYVGLGPFRFTNTKKNLSPIIGIEGYEKIISQLQAENLQIPIVAIGGIGVEDIKSILNTGIDGIAVSSLISESGNFEKIVNSILKSY
jgi:thiamine-phosphate pyrophosphorylase